MSRTYTGQTRGWIRITLKYVSGREGLSFVHSSTLPNVQAVNKISNQFISSCVQCEYFASRPKSFHKKRYPYIVEERQLFIDNDGK